jgi:hypothetical protein
MLYQSFAKFVTIIDKVSLTNVVVIDEVSFSSCFSHKCALVFPTNGVVTNNFSSSSCFFHKCCNYKLGSFFKLFFSQMSQ